MILQGDYDEVNGFGEVRIDGKPLDSAQSQAGWPGLPFAGDRLVRDHSPDGFTWSDGRDPAQLALAILLHENVRTRTARALYQRFAAEFITGLPHGQFRIEVDVAAWVETNAEPEDG